MEETTLGKFAAHRIKLKAKAGADVAYQVME